MANTTKDNVLKIAPELSVITDDTIWDLILEDVKDHTAAVWGTNQEKAQRYLAAHLLTLAVSPFTGGISAASGGARTKEKVGEVEVNYKDVLSSLSDSNRYDTTKYGMIYNLIRRQSIVAINAVVV